MEIFGDDMECNIMPDDVKFMYEKDKKLNVIFSDDKISIIDIAFEAK